MQELASQQQSIKSSFTQSLFWLGSAQVLGRVVRLTSSIILARLLTPEVFGEIAIILTCFELICTPTRRITSASLIKMNERCFQAALKPAHKINWYAAIIAFVAMSLLSWPLAVYHQDLTLIPPMILMATSYLLLPFGMLHAAANLRANKMRIVGRAILWQTIGDGVLTAALALLGFGIWAIIIPKVLVILIWIGVHRYHNPLNYGSDSNHNSKSSYDNPNYSINCHEHKQTQVKYHQMASPQNMSAFIKQETSQESRFTRTHNQYRDDSEQIKKITSKLSEHTLSTKELLHFGSHVGLSDLSIALRQNIDYLLVGYFLGVEALGVYFFAFNTSLGISSAIIQGYGTALYSHLCSFSDNAKHKPEPQADTKNLSSTASANTSCLRASEVKNRYLHSLSVILKITVPIIILQAVLSPVYLPFVYGEHWIEAGALPVFILLCLSGLVRPFGEAASQLLISIDMQQLNLKLNICFTLLLVLTISVFSQWGLVGIACGILLIHVIAMPAMSGYIYFFILKAKTNYTTSANCDDKNTSKPLSSSTAKAFNQEVSHDA